MSTIALRSPRPLGPLGRLGRRSAIHWRTVAVVWVALAAGLGALAPRAEHALSGGGWQADGSDSVKARRLVERHFDGQGSYALLVVMVGWVFFRADTLTGAINFLRAMSGFSPALPTPYTVAWYLTPELWLALAAGIVGSTPIVPRLARWFDEALDRPQPQLGWAVSASSTAALGLLLVASIMQMAARTYNPFIYFRF